MSPAASRHAAARFAVIGNPIEHSRSPDIHRLFAEQVGIDLVYDKLLATPDSFEQTVKSFFVDGGAGLNITVPFKGDAWRLCEKTSTEADKAWAVNTLCCRHGELTGFNTDGSGLVRDITINLGQEIKNRRLLLLGAGGAIRGIVAPLIKCRPAAVTIVNRTRARAEELATLYAEPGRLSVADYEDLDKERFDIIVNGTSSSLDGAALPLQPGIFNRTELVYDMMYGPAATGFIGLASNNGARQVADGYGMLVEQAADSFRIWHDIRPETTSVIDFLRSEA